MGHIYNRIMKDKICAGLAENKKWNKKWGPRKTHSWIYYNSYLQTIVYISILHVYWLYIEATLLSLFKFLQVLDMDVLIKPKMEEEKQKYIAEQKKEATENAISTVKMKIKEKMEAEQAAREAEGERGQTKVTKKQTNL